MNAEVECGMMLNLAIRGGISGAWENTFVSAQLFGERAPHLERLIRDVDRLLLV